MEHEIKCINKFVCRFQPQILEIDSKNKFYTMVKYDIPFGNTKKLNERNIRRILFSISKDELFNQLNGITNFLALHKLEHRDINPGNLIFSEKERTIKLIDFYWCNFEDEKITLSPGGINGIYGTNDVVAKNKIKEQIEVINLEILKSIKNIKKIINNFGSKYYNGSSKHRGKSYTKIDIPNFESIPFHRDNSKEYELIKSNLNINPKEILDIGCTTGYTSFNLLRDFSPVKIIGYEADPEVLNFLLSIKRVFCLDNIDFLSGVSPETIFPKSDLVIFMNVHMWLYKIYGDKVNIIMKNLISSTKEIFFQTAGGESAGMFKVNNLTSKEEIESYLKSVGGKNIKFINTSKLHGGLRHLFKIEGGLK